MRHVVLTLSLAVCLALPAAAQTTDGGFGEIASPSVGRGGQRDARDHPSGPGRSRRGHGRGGLRVQADA